MEAQATPFKLRLSIRFNDLAAKLVNSLVPIDCRHQHNKPAFVSYLMAM